ncbi:MAG: metal transporter, partial [Deltaproteobacteria bacterium]|nr:metal transporter [Deltaproteobacteria bacterium]
MLTLSLAALVLGPLLHRVAGGSRRLLAALDGFTLIAIGGLVLVHSLPEAMEQAGWLAAVLALLGFFLPASLERWLHNAADAAHRATLLLALGGLAMHAVLDGAALAQHRFHLDLAVVLHRLPVGLTIWLLLYPRRGAKAPIVALSVLAVATIVGFFGGGAAFSKLPMAVGLLQGLVSGSLLHVVVHSAGERGTTHGWQWGAGIGALAAIALLAFLGEHPTHGGHVHDHANEHAIAGAFLAMARESAGPL